MGNANDYFFRKRHRMLTRSHYLRLILAALLLSLLLGTRAQAQTGAALLVKPWPNASQLFDGSGDAYFFNNGYTHKTNNEFRLDEYESTGRFRVLPGNEISPRIGYDFLMLDSHTSDARIPRILTDESIAFGTGLFKRNNWIGAVTLGVGYAGDKAFGEGDGWYVKSDLILAKQINDNDFLAIALDYNGNRPYYPDIPFPGFGYSHRFDPKLSVVLGAPFSSVSWKPIDRLDIEAEYDLLSDLKADISYEFIKHWSVYTGFDYRRAAFHTQFEERDHRLLFVQRRVEAGIRFKPTENIRLGIGIGYGFFGQFRTGFDFDKSHPVAYLSDEPYLHGGLQIRF